MISFVIPAHNEEACLPGTLDALFAAVEQVGRPYEVIVVNDSSTDRTGEIAVNRGVRVINVQHRQIAATRNSGVREARGDVLFFVDADTRANADAIQAGLAAIERGASGGGCVWHFDGWIPWWAHLLLPLGNAAGRLLKLVGGGFLFCRRSDFEAIGGFCERLFCRRGHGVCESSQAARPVRYSPPCGGNLQPKSSDDLVMAGGIRSVPVRGSWSGVLSQP